MTFNIHIRATSIHITPGKEAADRLYSLLQLLTYEDEYQEETKVLGFLLDEETDTLYIHKGVDLGYIKRILDDVNFIYDEFDTAKDMEFIYEEIVPPRNNDQVDVINFIAGIDTQKDSATKNQLFIVKDPGFGKMEPVSRKIPTPTEQGYTLMGDLKPGDKVFDKNGMTTTVLQTFDHGIQDVYKVTFGDGRTAYCGLQHLWAVYIGPDVEYSIYTLEDMMFLLDKGYQLSIPRCYPARYENKNNDNICYTDILNRVETIHKLKDRDHRIIHVEPDKRDMILQILYSLGLVAWIQDDGSIRYERYDHIMIKSIEYSHKEECRCILVSNPDHLYLTENFLVTHNTYCSTVGACTYGKKTLIIVHRDNLLKQWVKSLYKMGGIPADRIHMLSSKDLYDVAINKIDLNKDIYLLTHATFRSGLKRLNSFDKMKCVCDILGIGLKIVDEAHLEFKDTILIDFVFNVQRNIYLTATDGRSSKDENAIFKHVFTNTMYYKKSKLFEDTTVRRWIEYIIVECNTHVKQAIYRYRIAGGRGMNSASYGKWVIQYDKKKTHFKICRDILYEIYNRDSQSKVLIFMPLIDLCDELQSFLIETINHNENFDYELNIKTIHSKNTQHENIRNKQADVIITTIASCGTGTDIPGITDIICCSPYKSAITVRQTAGRIRYCGKQCHYYDIIDTSVQMDIILCKLRKKVFDTFVTGVKRIQWCDDE